MPKESPFPKGKATNLHLFLICLMAFSVLSEETVESVIRSACQALESFKERQWKYRGRDGKEVPVAQLIDKVLGRVRMYAGIGSIIVQHDPAFVAIVWGGFNFLLKVNPTRSHGKRFDSMNQINCLQVAGSDAEMIGKVAEAMDDILVITGTCRPYMEFYQHSNTDSGQRVYALLQELYQSIGEFSVLAQKFYAWKTARKYSRS